MSTKYFQSKNEKEINIINFSMLEEEAKKIIPAGGYGYISGGAEDEWTLKMNTEAFNHKQIVPRSLTDVEKPDLRTTIYGEKISMPIFMTTVASHGLAVGGSKGVTSVFKHFAKELKIVMQLAGCKTVEDIKKAKLLSIKY